MIPVSVNLTLRRGCGMNKSFFEQIQDAADYLNLDLNAQEMAQLAVDHEYSEENIRIVAEMFTYLQQKKKENIAPLEPPSIKRAKNF